MKLIDFDFLLLHCDDITLEEALREIRRENSTRRKVFERWARGQPSKTNTYRKQFTASAAIATVLATMTKEEWRRRMTAAFGQTALFTFQDQGQKTKE